MAPAHATQQTWTFKTVAKLLSQRLGWPPEKAAMLIDGVSRIIAKGLADKREVMIEDFAKLKLIGLPQGQEAAKPLVIPSAEVGDSLGQQLGIGQKAVSEAIRTYFNIIKEKLIANDKLKIERFLALKITEEKARIIDDPISGQKLISPAKKVISYMAHPKFKQGIGNREFAFIPALSIKEGVESIKTSTILLAIPEEDFFIGLASSTMIVLPSNSFPLRVSIAFCASSSTQFEHFEPSVQ